MAASPLSASSKTVQELLATGKTEIPESYIYQDQIEGAVVDDADPSMEIPVLDFSLLVTPSLSGNQELEKLCSALTLWGCFQVVNHGVESEFLNEVREVTKHFFALPKEEKKKYSRADADIEGYGNDMVLFDHQTLDWTDRLYLSIYPEDQRNLKLWPQNHGQPFKEIVDEYSKKLREVAHLILKAMAKSLKLKEDSFLRQCGDQEKVYARFNLYPPCPRPDHVLGLKPHADGSAVTILLQDKEVEGLQMFRDGKWHRVPIIPHALVVNVGDQAEIMSNGEFKSPLHRVVLSSDRVRISVAVFFIPGQDMEIGPVDELISEEKPRLYKEVKNFVDLFFQNYQNGKRPIDAVRI